MHKAVYELKARNLFIILVEKVQNVFTSTISILELCLNIHWGHILTKRSNKFMKVYLFTILY